jgi:hypothetical protein
VNELISLSRCQILIERISERTLPLRDRFLGLVDAGCTFKLALVQWISASIHRRGSS